MWHWINTHGFLVAVLCWGLAGVISCAPPLSPKAGWWTTWAYRIMQLVGASFDKVVHNSPYGQRLDSLEQTKDTKSPDGTTTSTRITATIASVPDTIEPQAPKP